MPVTSKLTRGVDSSIVHAMSTEVGLGEGEGLSLGDELSVNSEGTTVVISDSVESVIVALEHEAHWVVLVAISWHLVVTRPGGGSRGLELKGAIAVSWDLPLALDDSLIVDVPVVVHSTITSVLLDELDFLSSHCTLYDEGTIVIIAVTLYVAISTDLHVLDNYRGIMACIFVSAFPTIFEYHFLIFLYSKHFLN